MPDETAAARLADDLAASAKYHDLSREVLERTAAWALERHPRPRDAAKAARRKLHQIHSAFVTDRQMTDARRRMAALAPDAPAEEVAATCRAILRLHASTAEREPYVEDFYAAVLDGLDEPPQSVVDVAAGLNPFAAPWMGLAPGTRYHAVDLDHRMAALAERLAGFVGLELTAVTTDLLAGDEPVEADVILVLKTLPTLEQQQRGAARRLLERLRARRVAVSLPARSLGGREKGMQESYERLLDASLPDGWTRSEARVFPTENLFLLEP